MKKFLYTLILAAVSTVGCQKSLTDDIVKDPKGTPISLTVKGLGVTTSSESSDLTPTRAAGGPGQVMVDVADFGNSSLALYGVIDVFGTQEWATADRTINVLDAHVLADGSMVFTKNDEKIYFPASGALSVYSIYPSPQVVGSPVTINDNGMDAVSATINLPTTFAQQYDILQAKTEQVTATFAQSIKMTYEHVLSQLRFKIYRDASVTGRLTKITVKGVKKAEMSIASLALTPSTDPADQVQFVAYNGAAIDLTTTATDIGTTPILVIPGFASISTVTITVDGQDYTTEVPQNWELMQGKVNTLTLSVGKFGVRINGQWTVSPWRKGTDHSGDLENNGKIISVSSRMLDGMKATNLVIAPTFADVEIDGGYTHKGVPVKVANGVFTTDKFNTGIIHDEPLSLTALKLYTGAPYANATVVFDGKLTNGVTAVDQRKIIIDTVNSGKLTIFNGTAFEDYSLNMVFGGFGSGTEKIPYEVASPTTLINVSKFSGSTSATTFDGTTASGAHFAQVADIDLKNVPFTPITLRSGIYNGYHKKIKNLTISSNASAVGLFGAVTSPADPYTTIKGIIIESGSITYTGGSSTGVGSIAGTLKGARIINCTNRATVNGANGIYVGGIVGTIGNSGTYVNGCSNHGAVNGRLNVGGIVGEITNLSGISVFDCYNTGTVSQSTTANPRNFGGIAGKLTMESSGKNVLRNCYTTGVIDAPNDLVYSGAVIGWVNGSYSPPAEYKNLFYLSGTHSKAIGSDPTPDQSLSKRIFLKSSTELKDAAMLDVLNDGRQGASAVWQLDHLPSTNSGYPIFTWQ